jgi:hypothetical protein
MESENNEPLFSAQANPTISMTSVNLRFITVRSSGEANPSLWYFASTAARNLTGKKKEKNIATTRTKELLTMRALAPGVGHFACRRERVTRHLKGAPKCRQCTP